MADENCKTPSDRELLEMAAKAAGIEVGFTDQSPKDGCYLIENGDSAGRPQHQGRSMTQPLKRVGRRIVQVCEIVDRIGVGGSSEVYQHMKMDKHNISMYLRRSVGLGLLTVDRTQKIHRYRVVAGWREMLPRPKPAPVRVAVVPMLSVAMTAQSRSFPLAGVWA